MNNSWWKQPQLCAQRGKVVQQQGKIGLRIRRPSIKQSLKIIAIKSPGGFIATFYFSRPPKGTGRTEASRRCEPTHDSKWIFLFIQVVTVKQLFFFHFINPSFISSRFLINDVTNKPRAAAHAYTPFMIYSMLAVIRLIILTNITCNQIDYETDDNWLPNINLKDNNIIINNYLCCKSEGQYAKHAKSTAISEWKGGGWNHDRLIRYAGYCILGSACGRFSRAFVRINYE